MQCLGRKSWNPPAFSGLLDAFPVTRAWILLVAFVGLVLQSLAEDVEVPDYFSSARSQDHSTSRSQIGEELTEADAESVVAQADDALQKLAEGDASAEDSFASIFGASVDYYDEGQKTPRQIASDKATIFRNYHSYSAQRLGNLVLSDTNSPNVKWVNFTYRYAIVKKSGGMLRGVAEASWALRKMDGKVFVIATREKTHKQ
jgi:hypothetical protein